MKSPLHSVLVIGSFGPDTEAFRTPAFSRAGNTSQLGLIEGLRAGGVNVTTVAFQPIPIFPRSRRWWVKGKHWRKSLSESWVSFINVPFLKQLTLATSILWASTLTFIRSKPQVVISYNATAFIGIPAIILSRLFRVPYCPLIYDLPLPNGTVKEGFAQRLDLWAFHVIMSRVSGLLVGAVGVAEDFSPGKPYLLVEAGLYKTPHNLSGLPIPAKENDHLFHIVFAGALEDFNGIDIMISAIEKMSEKDIRLHLAGRGHLQTYASEAAARDGRIIYHGFISGSELSELYLQANLLVNHRNDSRMDSRYGFSSKLLEYLASGIPVACSEFECLPSDYRPYLNIMRDTRPDALIETIRHIRQHPEAATLRAKQGRDFVNKHKSWDKQADRIKNFLEIFL